MDFKIYGLCVSKDEASRYLESCLRWNSQFLDGIFIYDDFSTDDTFEIASKYSTIVRRSHLSTEFFDDESIFRETGWNIFKSIFKPVEGDYIFAFDLDEFWYGPDLYNLALELNGSSGIVRRPEMWSYDTHRVDDLWKTIENIRLFPFKPEGGFKRKKLAGGSHPEYAEKETSKVPGFLLHYGYATPEDRKIRFDRYISRSGHNTRHIKSILQGVPDIRPIPKDFGEFPKVWRGDDLHI